MSRMPLGRFTSFRLKTPAREEPVALDAPADRPLLVVGLGNPDDEYARTRHNVGAWLVAMMAQRHHVTLKREGRISTGRANIDGFPLHLARPRSYYNEVGGPVAAELRRLKAAPSQMIVVYDDLDLPVGQTRMRLEGGTGGNNGMKSIIGVLGTQSFPRIRVGIDRPYDHGAPVRDPERIAAWVLSSPSGPERRALEEALERVTAAIELSVAAGYEAGLRYLNQESRPPA